MKQRPTWLQKKLVEPPLLKTTRALLRQQGKTLATLNGSFDLLHAGHLFILYEASQQADELWVALNSDASVKSYKGANRPIISLEDRLAMVAALEFVSRVTWFEEPDPRSLLLQIRPDVHVNGEEYGEACIEADVVRQGGGIVHLVRRIPGLATSQVIEKIRTCN